MFSSWENIGIPAGTELPEKEKAREDLQKLVNKEYWKYYQAICSSLLYDISLDHITNGCEGAKKEKKKKR